MARTVRDANLETRSARGRLKPRKKPYWRGVERGLHVGYYRGAKGGAWVARRYVGDGRYEEATLGTADDVLDADGIAIFDFHTAQARARAWFQAEARKAAGLGEVAQGPFTIADAAQDYLAWYARHRKALAATRQAIEAHILPELGEVEVAKLTTARIRRWHEALAETPPRVRTCVGAPQRHRQSSTDPEAVRARRASANRLLTVLKAALSHAHREGNVPSADAWQRVRPFRGADAARLRWLQEDECRRLLNACPEDFRRLVHGALATGCRYGELCRAEVGDFNRDAGALLIREAKSGKPRWVPLDDGAVQFLETITVGRPVTERLFLRADGKPWGKSHQARPLLEACKAARIEPPANFHALRHAWAAHRVMNGAPLLVIAQVLGHADTRMVEKHYGHLAPSFVRDTLRRTAMALPAHDPGTLVPLRPAL